MGAAGVFFRTVDSLVSVRGDPSLAMTLECRGIGRVATKEQEELNGVYKGVHSPRPPSSFTHPNTSSSLSTTSSSPSSTGLDFTMPGGPVTFDKGTGPISKPAGVRQALPAIGVAAFAAFGGILFGYDTGTISGILAMSAFRRQYGEPMAGNPSIVGDMTPGNYLTTSNTSLVVSILSAGTFFGALAGAPLADFFGRRWGIQIALLVFVVGVILQMVSSALPLFTVGRVIAGLGVGIVSTIVPMYQSETAPRWIRGAVVSGYQWCITIGLLLAAIVNNSTKDRTDTGAYRIPIGVQFAYAIIMSVGLLILPESPRWLVKVGKPERAAKALAVLNSASQDDAIVRAELADIQTAYDFEKANSDIGYLACFAGGERKIWLRTMTGTLLQGWQQLTGINFIFYYGTIFFESTNAGDPFIFTIASNVVNVVMTVPSFFLMERAGRRWLLIGGAFYMAVCELIVASLGTHYGGSNPDAQKALVAFVCIYVAGFAATWGPAAWVVCGEIFPTGIRAKAMSLCTASNWLWNFGIGYATPYLVDQGPGKAGLGSKVFWIWTATCFCAGIFAYFFVYETKGLSLEEVDQLYCSTSPLGSPRVNKELKDARTDVEKAVGPLDDEAVTANYAKQHVVSDTKEASLDDK